MILLSSQNLKSKKIILVISRCIFKALRNNLSMKSTNSLLIRIKTWISMWPGSWGHAWIFTEKQTSSSRRCQASIRKAIKPIKDSTSMQDLISIFTNLTSWTIQTYNRDHLWNKPTKILTISQIGTLAKEKAWYKIQLSSSRNKNPISLLLMQVGLMTTIIAEAL